MERIIENLILLQDHFAMDPCADCCLKHTETIEAYAREGLALDHSLDVKEMLDGAIESAQKWKGIIVGCINDEGKCEIKKPEDMQNLIQEARALRRELNMSIYRMAGDLIYENEQGHSHDLAHHHLGEHDHGHEEPQA